MLGVRQAARGETVKPLEAVNVTMDVAANGVGAEGGALSVRDGEGREYVRVPASDGAAFRAGGALGRHVVFLEDDDGRVVESTSFRVDCRTRIEDEGGRFAHLLDMLYYTLMRWGEGDHFARIEGKFYRSYVRWLRDHVHALKGMKWFDGDVKSGIELYADFQEPNGMIWDRTEAATREATWRDHTFSYGGFIRAVDGGTRRFERIPVENDVEYLFVEGLYYTWKATGDTGWMASLLDNAIRAYQYSTTDPHRWSEKHRLLKRGFTIDTWDFQSAEDTAVTGQAMVVDKDRSRFGVMHGDNTGFAAGCRYLAEMLEAAGRGGEAERYRVLGREILERLDELSWNGEFYVHHVPEDPAVKRDLGVDLDRQVSLSNAYDLNRGITHEQCVAILSTYQRIRREMPSGSPGEFYQIYPPFERGFGDHNARWEYMNGGVTTIVAGELARGAFEHGFEPYGVDILDRVRGWGEAHGGYLHCCLKGARAEEPERSFEPVDISAQANADVAGEVGEGVPGWTGEGPENDLREIPSGRHEYHGVPFEIIDPAANGRRGCIGLSSLEGYAAERKIPVGRSAASIYLTHTFSGARGRGALAGRVRLRYGDGTSFTQYVTCGAEVGPWYMPRDQGSAKKRASACRVAWRGGNRTFPNVGTYVWGLDNPHPDKVVREIALHAAENDNMWFVLGVALCDSPVWFDPGDVSFGIPDNWGAAAVVYALIEGLAGMQDAGVAFDRARVVPRWAAARVNAAEAVAKYEASGGYVAYRYRLDEERRTLTVEFTGNAEETRIEVLLPEGASAKSVSLDGAAAEYDLRDVERSTYVALSVKGARVHTVEIGLA